MSQPLFFYGTLCHAPLREVVLGLGHSVSEARLEGHTVGLVEGHDVPVVVPGDGEVRGLLSEGIDKKSRARTDYFEIGAGLRVDVVEVNVGGRGRVEALTYVPAEEKPGELKPWDLGEWVDVWGPTWVEAAREAMAGVGKVSPEQLAKRWPMIKLRASTKLRAAAGAEAKVRADLTAARDVEVLKARRPYTEYFSLEDHDLKFRRFDGSWSPVVRRAGFIGGDAATVLPYDPALDAVLVVEQFRAGPFMRGDPRPWTLEPIAGRIDPGESPRAAVRREAMEEAGIRLGTLHYVAEYYASPGAATEYVYSFVGEAHLAGRGGEVGGAAGEDEDIRAHVLRFDNFMKLVESGEAGTGPLILTAYWLLANRDLFGR